MYFTLAVSAATLARCAALTSAALGADPRVMPVPGPALVAWRAPDGRAPVLHWGDQAPASLPSRGMLSRGLPCGAASYAGTIWAEGVTVRAQTALTRSTWPRNPAPSWSVTGPAGRPPSPGGCATPTRS